MPRHARLALGNESFATQVSAALWKGGRRLGSSGGRASLWSQNPVICSSHNGKRWSVLSFLPAAGNVEYFSVSLELKRRPSMTARFSALTLLMAVLVVSGCATVQPQFKVMVDSISDGSFNKKSYILLPGNKDTTSEDLQFKEYAAYVNRALIKQDFVLAESLEKANVAIFLAYGIGDPKEHQYSYSIPTWGQAGVSSSYTTGTINSYGGYGSYSGTTTYAPTYGVTGSTTHTGSYSTYFRFMVLDAIDLDEFKKSKKEVQLWKTTAISSGSSGDLRLVFPNLVAASQQYVGKNTGQKVEVNLYEQDERVIEIKGTTKTEKKGQ